MKKTLQSMLLLVFVYIVYGFVYADASYNWSNCEQKEFIVTAYYSPVADQAFYYKDTFEEEKILNGEGKAGASGKRVFNGMLAAPSGYNFGDKIYFEGLGVGEVADRGGAIVHAGNRGYGYDRIDIRMGYGEEGLVRALGFGVQKLKGYYCDVTKMDKMPKEIGFDMNKIPIFKYFFDVALWKQTLYPGRKDVWVWYLQKYLIKLGYLDHDLQTGFFGKKTQTALCQYQTDRLISSRYYKDCGVFGPRTRVRMKDELKRKSLLPKNLWEHGDIKDIHNIAIGWDVTDSIESDISIKKFVFTKPFYKNTYDVGVIKLQDILRDLGYYNGDSDGVFNGETIKALYKFQLEKGILYGTKGEENLRGYLGPKTRAALNKIMEDIKNKERMEQLEAMIMSEKKKNTFQFYRPYKKYEGPNKEIRILQNLLSKLGLYNGKISGIYDAPTIDAVFDYQLKYGILTKDSHYTLHGYLGPSTRDRMNQMLLLQ